MDFRILIEPQEGITEADQIAAAQRVEGLGFSGFFRTDHLIPLGPSIREGRVAMTETWLTLGLLARETNSIQLGSMVTSITFRHPGLLALQVTQVAGLSGGRIEVGLGAGWNGREHSAFGIPFPTLPQRQNLLADTAQMMYELWHPTETTSFSFNGTNLRFVDCPVAPLPANGAPPIIIGGKARSKGVRLAVRYAAEYNLDFPRPGEVAGARDRLNKACEEVGRQPSDLRLSASHLACVGRTASDLRTRADRNGIDLRLKLGGLVGTLSQVRTQLAGLAALGVDRFYLQVPDPSDAEHLELLAELREAS